MSQKKLTKRISTDSHLKCSSLTHILKRIFLKKGRFDALLNISGNVYREIKNRRTVQFQLGGKSYFIKIHRGSGWWEIFKELFQGRLPVVSAAREWQAVERLEHLKLKTLKVAGKGIRGWNPASLHSFIVTEALERMITLEDLIVDWVGLPMEKTHIVETNAHKKVS